MYGVNGWVYVYAVMALVIALVIVVKKLRNGRRRVVRNVSPTRHHVQQSNDTMRAGGHVASISRLPYDASRDSGWPDIPAA